MTAHSAILSLIRPVQVLCPGSVAKVPLLLSVNMCGLTEPRAIFFHQKPALEVSSYDCSQFCTEKNCSDSGGGGVQVM